MPAIPPCSFYAAASAFLIGTLIYATLSRRPSKKFSPPNPVGSNNTTRDHCCASDVLDPLQPCSLSSFLTSPSPSSSSARPRRPQYNNDTPHYGFVFVDDPTAGHKRTSRRYQPRKQTGLVPAPSLLRCGDIEINPGPIQPTAALPADPKSEVLLLRTDPRSKFFSKAPPL